MDAPEVLDSLRSGRAVDPLRRHPRAWSTICWSTSSRATCCSISPRVWPPASSSSPRRSRTSSRPRVCTIALAVLTGPTIAPEVAARSADHGAGGQRRSSRWPRSWRETLSAPTLRLRAGTRPARGRALGRVQERDRAGVRRGRRSGDRGRSGRRQSQGRGLHRRACARGCALLPELGARRPRRRWAPPGVGDLFVTATSPHGRNRGRWARSSAAARPWSRRSARW